MNIDALVTPAVLESSLLINSPSAWLGHIPFGVWIVETVQPEVLVELGTHYGHSYFTFCSSVVKSQLSTKCYAVDTWQGDEQAGQYDGSIYSSVKKFNDNHFKTFSKLLCMTFDEAVSKFEDGSIDILHIDGLHTYNAVRHDFETWAPKLSDKAVVLFHDTNVHERDFGVWQLWNELSTKHPHIHFNHSYGLGVLFVGKNQPLLIKEILRECELLGGPTIIPEFFAKMGQCIELEYNISDRDGQIVVFKQTLAERDRHILSINQLLAARDTHISSLNQALADRDNQISSLSQEISSINKALAECYEHNAVLSSSNNKVINSLSWRITKPFRFVRRLFHVK
jgi:hypothetical protein